MTHNLSENEIARLKELHGEDKVSAYLEVAQTVEAGEIAPAPTKEQTDKIASNMIV
jgi:hypothetical protein